MSTERELRERIVALQAELRVMSAQAAGLFHTSGWIRTEDEPPPLGLRVLGASYYLLGWYERLDNGKWMHDSMNGRLAEGPHGPTWWMVIPPTPDAAAEAAGEP